jgi:hypothetical protein
MLQRIELEELPEIAQKKVMRKLKPRFFSSEKKCGYITIFK